MKKGFRVIGLILLIKGLTFLSADSFGQKITSLDPSSVPGTSIAHSHSEKCAHTLIQARIEKEMGYFGSEGFFEDWIDQKIEIRKTVPQIARLQEDPRLIPVVVHVIHNGTSVGTGANIPDSQILEQIRILNEDFRRLNADASLTPAEFLPVAADANIEFVLAKQDPDGLPTSGIVRVQGSKSTYDPNSDATLIGQTSQWNPDEYMNIWVVPLVSPYIGYATFPLSDLPGLNFSPTPANIDGVTIDYRYFGAGGSAVSASLGRTATHEVGHYFGLRHIWGDGGCDVDDFVTDTPIQDASNNLCNSNPSKTSCGVSNMIQNFMDYTPDACMNLFTNGQIERFNVVLENSPRRVTLVNNRATQEPVLAERDLSLAQILQPVDAICELTVVPQVVVQNAGTGRVTSARVEFRNNGVLIENRRFAVNLETGEQAILTFSSYQLQPSNNFVQFEITQVNDQGDENAENNSLSSSPVLQGEISLPYTFDPQNFPGDWVVSNPDQSMTWRNTSLTLNGQNQQAVYFRNYEYEAPGQYDYFISPIIDLDRYPNAQLVFEVAHAPYDQAGYEDELLISVSEDCSANFDLVDVKYQKSGVRLETSPSTIEEFIPTSTDQFRTEIFNLSSFQGLGKVRIAIVNKNAYGNNIYLRNIRILPTEELNYGVTIEEVLIPTPINTGSHTDEIVRVSNSGNLTISKFVFNRTSNVSVPESYAVTELNMAPGEEVEVEVPNSTQQGKNRLRFSVSEPNFDQNGDSPAIVSRYHLESVDSITAPWRQKFDSNGLGTWLTINPENDLTAWTARSVSSDTGFDNAAVLENGIAGNSYWLGTPTFDLTLSSQASVFFDLASGQVDPDTRLSLLASRDGGMTYSEVWSAAGQELSTVTVGEANPNSEGDYARKYVDLSSIAGSGSERARIAFVLTVAGSSNSPVYLDNIELFLNANPEPVIPTEGSSTLYPNPARDRFSLAFNLPTRDEVTIQIISSNGSIVHEVVYPGTLNQTYTFSTELFRTGVYLIRISGNSLVEMKRLIIN
ncbi:choice-of-anchor J domain-containing protein [Algoriphagus aestuariicola]|uniref:Choice-of-anchor J domain-containing protein n=1 Tax=Algoriphagus aestuariicola TaxID=1852016 RepID=A0ABS3BM34_9BACT|nr:choice-of-anchor J domain-containing protein [Algoriphagus aestuariicola]MBN7800368.1 choice-of-anchor J domain-containing protein [Algoriphagus aestuariicola]